MERPTVLLAVDGEAESYFQALERAGFAPTRATDGSVPDGSFDLGVIDCDLGGDLAASVYAALQENRTVPVLLMLGDGIEVPAGLGTRADELALKPLPPDALVYRLQALLIRGGRHLPTESGAWASDEGLSSAPIAGEGHAVSVFAPKGGVGKTTICVNVAVALRQQTRAEVLLFDADVGVGNVTSVLDVPFRLGLADLADSPPDEWTEAAFEQCVTTHAASGVRVMTWGTDPAESERISVDLLLAALRWAKQHHSYVIIDNHPGYDDRTMAMLAVANEIFLVVTPEVGAIRNSSQFLELARKLGLGSVVKVIVNRANHGIELDDMSASLGLPISATVVSNGPKAVIASNEGHPLVTKYPKERISDDLHSVARLISAPDSQPVTQSGASARRWWGRIGERTSHA
ncbi:MAG TPA: AAA family ATPase [Candidatus Limnocylindrales bacterium]|nr:AAA family ATPase [Candidatus Limnocylindrales bacterium]